MDFGDLIDNIGGIIVAVATLWGFIVTPTIGYIKERKKKKAAAAQRRPAVPARPAPVRRVAPAPRAVAVEHAAEEASFKPWPTSPQAAPEPLAVAPAVSPFISGEEGVRVTDDADTGLLSEPVSDSSSLASEILGSEPDDIRRGVIWAEIMTPRFRE